MMEFEHPPNLKLHYAECERTEMITEILLSNQSMSLCTRCKLFKVLSLMLKLLFSQFPSLFFYPTQFT